MFQTFEKALSGHQPSGVNEEMNQIILLFHSEDYQKAYLMASQRYSQSQSPTERSFLLHLICVFLENTYELALRSEWMAKWPLQIAIDDSPFSQAAHQFHLAVSCYFESYYSEAEFRFKQILSSEAPPRFLGLAHFHLGLIYRNRQLLRGAQLEMRMALKIATEIDNKRLIKRSSSQLMVLNSDLRFPLLNPKVRQLMESRKIKEAKKIYIELRRAEKSRGIKREKNCLHALLPVFSALNNNWGKVYRLLELIPDYSMKLQTVSFICLLGRETSELKKYEKHLQKHLGINPLEQIVETGEILFLGKSLKNIESEDLSKFAQYIHDHESVTKEGICRQVWNLDYDPVMHDGKIYKLIHQFRNYFGSKDVVVNRYGSYEINRRYRA